MTRERLYNILLVLLTLIAAIYLFKILWDMAASMGNLVLLFCVGLAHCLYLPACGGVAGGRSTSAVARRCRAAQVGRQARRFGGRAA